MQHWAAGVSLARRVPQFASVEATCLSSCLCFQVPFFYENCGVEYDKVDTVFWVNIGDTLFWKGTWKLLLYMT